MYKKTQTVNRIELVHFVMRVVKNYYEGEKEAPIINTYGEVLINSAVIAKKSIRLVREQTISFFFEDDFVKITLEDEDLLRCLELLKEFYTVYIDYTLKFVKIKI